MSVWTLSIPFATGRRGLIHMVQTGKELWIVNEPVCRDCRADVFVFSTELQKLSKVSIDFPLSLFVVAVVAHVDKIYFWMIEFDIGHSLYQFDTNTRKFEFVMKAEGMNEMIQSPTIVGNFMYLLDDDFSTNSMLLRKVDLVEKRMLETQTLKTLPCFRPNYDLSSVDNDLYLLESEMYENVRTVFKIGDDGLEQIHKEVYRGNAKFKSFEGCVILEQDDSVSYLDSFDFATNKWIRQQFGHHTDWIPALVKTDDIVYTLVDSKTVPAGYEIRMFERLPSLEKRCILNVIDEIIESENFNQVDEFEQILPPMLKQTANRMIYWKIKEHEHLMSMTGNSRALRRTVEGPNGEVDESQEVMDQ